MLTLWTFLLLTVCTTVPRLTLAFELVAGNDADTMTRASIAAANGAIRSTGAIQTFARWHVGWRRIVTIAGHTAIIRTWSTLTERPNILVGAYTVAIQAGSMRTTWLGG